MVRSKQPDIFPVQTETRGKICSNLAFRTRLSHCGKRRPCAFAQRALLISDDKRGDERRVAS